MYAPSIKDAPRTPRYAANPTKNKKARNKNKMQLLSNLR